MYEVAHKLVNCKNIMQRLCLLDSERALVSGLLTDVVVPSKEKEGDCWNAFQYRGRHAVIILLERGS